MKEGKLKAWCIANVNFKRAATVFAGFLVLFLSSLGYLSLTEHTTLGIALLTSFSISFFFVLAICTSKYVRCAALIFIPQLLSPVGLIIFFYCISWGMVLQPSIEDLLELQKYFENLNCNQGLETPSNAQVMIGTLHYLPIAAMGIVFLYCVGYVLTLKSDSYHDQSYKSKRGAVQKLLWQILVYLTIAVGTFAVCLSCFRSYVLDMYREVLKIRRCSERPEIKEGAMLEYYGCVCIIISTVACFSVGFSKKRRTIVNKIIMQGDGQATMYGQQSMERKSKPHFLFFMKTKSNKDRDRSAQLNDPLPAAQHYRHRSNSMDRYAMNSYPPSPNSSSKDQPRRHALHSVQVHPANSISRNASEISIPHRNENCQLPVRSNYVGDTSSSSDIFFDCDD